MTTSDVWGTNFSRDEKDFPLYFSEWIKRRRLELDLTQEQLAQRACCSVYAIRKIEGIKAAPRSYWQPRLR